MISNLPINELSIWKAMKQAAEELGIHPLQVKILPKLCQPRTVFDDGGYAEYGGCVPADKLPALIDYNRRQL